MTNKIKKGKGSLQGTDLLMSCRKNKGVDNVPSGLVTDSCKQKGHTKWESGQIIE